jgi:hypothetical protein
MDKAFVREGIYPIYRKGGLIDFAHVSRKFFERHMGINPSRLFPASFFFSFSVREHWTREIHFLWNFNQGNYFSEAFLIH